MNRLMNTGKSYKFQSALPQVFTPNNILPYAYCQDGGCLPVVYGRIKLNGTILSADVANVQINPIEFDSLSDPVEIGATCIGTDLETTFVCIVQNHKEEHTRPIYGQSWFDFWRDIGKDNLFETYIKGLWYGICCGKVSLESIYKNTDAALIEGVDFSHNFYNDGTGTYVSDLGSKTTKLSGIAQMSFNKIYTQLLNVDNKIPDLKFIVKREGLQEGVIDYNDLTTLVDVPYRGDTWVYGFSFGGFIYYDTIPGVYAPQRLYHLIYNNEIRLPYVNPSTGGGIPFSTALNDWAIDANEAVTPAYRDPNPFTRKFTWGGGLWSTRGRDAYPYQSGRQSGYETISGEYKVRDLVIGDDNNVYSALRDHTPSFSNKPGLGALWEDCWELVGLSYVWSYGSGSVDVGLIYVYQGNAYRCIKTQPFSYPDTPVIYPLDTGGEEFWRPAAHPPWIDSKVYGLTTATFLEGQVIEGTDENNYVCITPTNAELHLPITGSSWSDYWHQTIWPPINEQYSSGTDMCVYELKLFHTAGSTNKPITGEFYDLYWTKFVTEQTKFIGNNPAAIVYDILTNSFYGLNIPTTKINKASFNAAAQYYNNLGFGINVAVTDIGEAKKLLISMVDWVDMILTVGTDGRIMFNTLDPAVTPVGTLYDEDFSSFTLTRQSWREVYNEFEATYRDPDRLYEATSIVIKNEAAIEMCGSIIRKKSIDLMGFTDFSAVTKRINQIMRRESYPRNTISCEVSGAWYFVRPGDIINITKTEYMVIAPYRVTSVGIGKMNELVTTIELIEAVECFDNIQPTEGIGRLISPLSVPFTQTQY